MSQPADERSTEPEARRVVTGPTAQTDADAAAAGLTVHRDVLQMRRPLPLDQADAALAAATRRFVPGSPDEQAWITANNRAFASHPDQSGFTPQRLHQAMAEPWFDPEGFRLHHRRGVLAAFCWTKIHPPSPDGTDPALGEIYVIGVDPDYQGQGLGRALTIAGLVWLGAKGLTTGMLYVDATNTRARSLYEQLGYTLHLVDRVYEAPNPQSSPTPTTPPIT